MKRIHSTPNWGANLPPVLDVDDVLPIRPPAFNIEGREIDPPGWAIKATCKVGGKRHPKREITYSTGVHYNTTALAPPWRGALADQRDEAIKHALSRRERRNKNRGAKGASNTPSVRKAVPKGNLREEDYRFWKGYVSQDEGAQCRWCNSVYAGKQLMAEHHKQTSCKDYLLALFRYAKQCSRTQRYCFSCKKQTGHFRWGIPLCQTTECLANWKFTISEHLHGFVQYREWADDENNRDAAQGPYKDVPGNGDSNMYCC